MGSTASGEGVFSRRIYPLDPRELTAEQLAVVFAMTSRRPEPFDEIAKLVTTEKAADFHERWVLGYGHASVAEHAILHLAVENISRLACDALEDNRLASYTEKSSRFQVLPWGYYHVSPELDADPRLKQLLVNTCDTLFATYHQLIGEVREYLAGVRPRQEGERDGAYQLRLRREATDTCRFLLPAATLTNVGVTMNARSVEHAIQKLLSSDLQEEREIGEALKRESRRITPTLVKYADYNPYLAETRAALGRFTQDTTAPGEQRGGVEARLLHFDPQAEEKVIAALLYAVSHEPFAEVWSRALAMTSEERAGVLREALSRLGPFDAPLRALEFADYIIEFTLDYGAYRELKRHRLMSYVPQPLTVAHGYVVPPLLERASLTTVFEAALRQADDAYRSVATLSPRVAEYLVTHAHRRQVLVKLNLRECYHLFKLRTGPQTHFTLQKVIGKALSLCQEVHPRLFQYLRRRAP